MKHIHKNIRSPMVCLLLAMGLLVLPFSHADAAGKKDKQDRIAQRRLQQMQQKFEQDKAVMEQENAALKEQVKTAETKLTTVQATLSRQQHDASKLRAANAEKDSALAACCRDAESAKQAALSEHAADQEKIADLQHKLGDTTQGLKQSEVQNKQLIGEKSQLEAALTEQKTEVLACTEKNARLINMSTELMKKYEKEALSGVEPLTGLKGVEIENHFQDTRDQIEAQLYKPRK
jgi:septal ring factor EnvC (AmiA/AmiB activator)